MESYLLIIGAFLALIVAGFFSAVEMAYQSANRLYFELRNQQGPVSDKLINEFLRNPILFVGTTLFGNTLFLVVFTVLGVLALHPALQGVLPHQVLVVTGLETLLLTLLFLSIGDYIPKSLVLIHPDRFLEAVAVPIWVFYRGIAPLIQVLVWLARFFIRLFFGKKNPEIRPVFGLTDLNHFLQQANQKAKNEEDIEVDSKIFNNAIEFREVLVRDCLVPRTDISAIDVQDSIATLQKAFQQSGHSKILVYRDSIDDIIGYCHALSLFQRPDTIESIVRPVLIVPESKPAQDLLRRFLDERKNLAVVVDEFGGTAGLVSMEDLVEQIFGEIQDEYDASEDWEERQLDAHTWQLSARHEITDLNEKYGWALPESEAYDTLGGLIQATHEAHPQVGEVIEVPPYTFTIVSMNGSRIDIVNLTV